jgi:oxygen-dependent protoporphyrinogen oxidase
MRSAFPRLWEAEGRSGSVIRDFLGKKEKKDPERGGPDEAAGKGAEDFLRREENAAAAHSRGDAAAAPRHRARTLTFDTGLYLLIETLQQRLLSRGACRIETNAAATSLEGPLAGPGPRWRVRTADGRAFDADVLVSTLEAPVLAGLLGDRLPRSSAALAAVKSAPVTVVALAWPDGPRSPRGFGALVPRGEGIRSLGVLYPSSLFPGRAPAGSILTTSFLGGALDSALAAAPDAEVLAVATDEARLLHPALSAPARSWIFRWRAAIPQIPLLHHRTLAALDEDLKSLPGLVPTGGWRDGVAMGVRIESGERVGRSL